MFLLASVTIGTSVRAEEPLGRGKRWVRSHPFNTMALTIISKSFDPHEYKAANMTTVLAWKPNTGLLEEGASVGLPWHLNVRRRGLNKDGLTDQTKARLKNLHDNYSGCTGWIVWDEPKRSEMFIVAKAIQWLKETYPDTLVYSNAYPMGGQTPMRRAKMERYYGGELPEGGYSYEQYLRDFATIMKPDVIMYDAYIFRQSGETSNLFPTMMTGRKVAQERGVPCWSFVQSYADKLASRNSRTPSESDVRMQVFMHLTSGYTGIAYFTYEDQQGPAMVSNADRQLRPLYYHVARLNQEVLNVGQALRFLESTAVRYVPGSGNRVPEGVTAWQPGDGGVKQIKAITIEDAEPDDWKDVLVGFFTDDRGRRYFMLTNLWHDMDASSAQRALTVTLTLDRKVKMIGRLSRETGRPESLAVTGGKFRMTLPGGTGDLLRFGDAEFPGLGHDLSASYNDK